MGRFLHLVPLLAASFLLAIGNGMQTTLITLRGTEEGFSATIIGILGTAYFVGFLAGARYAPRIIDTVGHIRVYAAMAAIAGTCILVPVLLVDHYAWIGSRLAAGFAMASLYTALESWLNGSSENRDRGRILSFYSLLELMATTLSQLVLPVIGISGFDAFALTAICMVVSLVPIALSPGNVNVPQSAGGSSIFAAFQVSPIAFVTCLLVGITNSSFRTVGPLYATQVGFDLSGVALFITASIVGGAIMQFPLGYLSDRIDRRMVLISASALAGVASVYVATLSGDMFERNVLGTVLRTGTDPTLYIAGAVLFGAFSMPLYSLAAAHANDHAQPHQFAGLAAGLLFTYGIGSTIGPTLGSILMTAYGPPWLFVMLAAAHIILVVVTLQRIAARPAAPEEDKGQFTLLPRTTPTIFRLARRRLSNQPSPGQLANAPLSQTDSPAGTAHDQQTETSALPVKQSVELPGQELKGQELGGQELRGQELPSSASPGAARDGDT
ncbi:MAG: MFS transporter [Pseudomonadota bacterium]